MEMKVLEVQLNCQARESGLYDHSVLVQWRFRRWFRLVTGTTLYRGAGTVFYNTRTGRRPRTLIESLLSDAVDWSCWEYSPRDKDLWHKV